MSSENKLLKTIYGKLQNNYRLYLKNAFDLWKQCHFLPIFSRVQINLGKSPNKKVWFWGDIIDYYDGHYTIQLDCRPGKVYKHIPRKLIKPQTYPLKSIQIIDWNEIENIV